MVLSGFSAEGAELYNMGLWSCLVSLQMGQNCITWDCGPVWFIYREGRTVEHGTVVLSGFSADGAGL